MKKQFEKEFSILWKLLMPLESNVVTDEEAGELYLKELDNKNDIQKILDLYVKDYFLTLTKTQQEEVISVIDKLILEGKSAIEYFFTYEFGLATQEPRDWEDFFQLMRDILASYVGI